MSTENADFLLRRAREAGITDPRELANFMGQMQVESGGFVRMSESLHYSGKRLLEVFPGRNGLDDLAEANRIAAGGPEAVANAIYGGVWGKRYLGNIHPGDGWAYHGRGYVQLTGRANYARVGRELGLDLINHPELAEDRETAARIALHYWKTRVVANGHQHDVREATRDINGGYTHLAERMAASRAWEGRLALGGVTSKLASATQQSQAELDVGRLQGELTKLGYRDASGHVLEMDGHFGPRTREAVQAFQRAHGIDAIGIVGPRTRAALDEAARHVTPLDPAHPDHVLHRQSVAAVHKLDGEMGRQRDTHSERLEASVTRLARENGLTHIDHVLVGNGNVFVVQGGLDDPARRVAHMPLERALGTPAVESIRPLALPMDAIRDSLREQAVVPVRQAHFEHQEGMRRMPAP